MGRLKAIGSYLADRLHESSTLAGLIKFCGGMLCVTLTDTEANTIASATLIVAGLFQTLTKDRYE